jgi:hypothetical protein
MERPFRSMLPQLVPCRSSLAFIHHTLMPDWRNADPLPDSARSVLFVFFEWVTFDSTHTHTPVCALPRWFHSLNNFFFERLRAYVYWNTIQHNTTVESAPHVSRYYCTSPLLCSRVRHALLNSHVGWCRPPSKVVFYVPKTQAARIGWIVSFWARTCILDGHSLRSTKAGGRGTRAEQRRALPFTCAWLPFA